MSSECPGQVIEKEFVDEAEGGRCAASVKYAFLPQPVNLNLGHTENLGTNIISVLTYQDGTPNLGFSSGQLDAYGVVITQLPHVRMIQFPVKVIVIKLSILL